MTDRELLELAAKAVGYTLLAEGKKPRLALHDDDPVYGAWNPLTDDGDAFRLAVKLRMLVDMDDLSVNGLHFETGKDRAAAVRRAIVRAAAEIGRAMP